MQLSAGITLPVLPQKPEDLIKWAVGTQKGLQHFNSVITRSLNRALIKNEEGLFEIRRDNADDIQGFLLATSTGTDWKIYKPSGGDDLIFWNDNNIEALRMTAAGTATFASIPIGPAANPTTDNQFSRKAYVDGLVTSPSSINPGHKHSKLYASDGDPEAVSIAAGGDANFIGSLITKGQLTFDHSYGIINFGPGGDFVVRKCTVQGDPSQGYTDRFIVDNNGNMIMPTGSISLNEITAPGAPSTNGVIVYAVDNGSGKTKLMAIFASGGAQQIAIEP